MTASRLEGLTDSEQGIQTFPKPDPGTWTEAFGLGTGPVSLRGIHDPVFYEDEKEAVFRRSWLFMGRIESVARPGNYFVRELEFLGVSIIVVKGMDGVVRAFHNVCSHRGNKLVWDEHPARESKGMCRQFACKYHGWRFDLEGNIGYVHNAPEFFDLTVEDLKLPEIHCDVWAGFIFVNLLDVPLQTLREFLTPLVTRLESYPFDKMTEGYVCEGRVESNWKVFIDAYQELYHVPYVHSKMNNPNAQATGTDKVPFMVPMFLSSGKHRMYSSGGPKANSNVRSSRPLDGLFRSSFYGPIDPPEVGPLGDGINPGGIENWGLDNWMLYPNFTVQTWGLNWYTIYEHWPLGPDAHRFTLSMFFVPPATPVERLSQEHAVLSVREFVLQDFGSCQTLQNAVKTNPRDCYHLNDQEVLVRHLHHCVTTDVQAFRAEKGS